MIALVDVNNFYVSCERLFNPKLSNKPIKKIVSSKDAKKLSQSEIEKIIQFGLRSNEL